MDRQVPTQAGCAESRHRLTRKFEQVRRVRGGSRGSIGFEEVRSGFEEVLVFYLRRPLNLESLARHAMESKTDVVSAA
jgi:hypothetical protein